MDDFKREIDRQTERAATEVPKLIEMWVPGEDDGTIFDRLKVATGKDRIFRVPMKREG